MSRLCHAHKLIQERAKAAAERLMKERGAIVIGFPADSPHSHKLQIGDHVMTFANVLIPGKEFKLVAPATWADWDRQAKLLGLPNQCMSEKGQRIFFAHMVDVPEDRCESIK